MAAIGLPFAERQHCDGEQCPQRAA
jgi:hypothetical protein